LDWGVFFVWDFKVSVETKNPADHSIRGRDRERKQKLRKTKKASGGERKPGKWPPSGNKPSDSQKKRVRGGALGRRTITASEQRKGGEFKGEGPFRVKKFPKQLLIEQS